MANKTKKIDTSDANVDGVDTSEDEAVAKTVELKDKDTGFYDPVTGFQVVRDQQVQLGSTIGDATQVAIASGRLLIVED